jgi:hypothetical protein
MDWVAPFIQNQRKFLYRRAVKIWSRGLAALNRTNNGKLATAMTKRPAARINRPANVTMRVLSLTSGSYPASWVGAGDPV